jgi:lipopolysaccharide transport system permease protein
MSAERTTVIKIKAQTGWKTIDVKEVIRYKDLLYFLVVRGIKAKYAQSILGIGWAIIQPLFSALVYTVVFGRLAGVSSDGVPYAIFTFVAIIPWNYFADTLNESSNSLVQNANMISKVYFPRVILPLSSAFSKLLDFLIGFIVVIVFLIYYRIMPGANIIFLPFLMIILLMTSLGAGMILSAMAIQFRDVKYAMTFVVQLLMYAAPVVYPASKVPEKFILIYSLNPMVGVIEGFRSAILSTYPMPWHMILPGLAVSVLLFVFGLFYFRKMERIFADVA